MNFADPNQTFHFIKNLIMTGGLLQIVTYGAGALSIDNRHARTVRGPATRRSATNPEALRIGGLGGDSMAPIRSRF